LDAELKEKVEGIIHYRFKDSEILVTAMTHRALIGSSNRKTKENQRLEFIGDSILSFVVSNFLYDYFTDHDEGFLSKIRSRIVDNRNLSIASERIGIKGVVLSLRKGRGNQGSRLSRKIFGDIYESLIGALYMDGGIKSARAFIMRTLLKEIEEISMEEVDHKTLLQEWCQKKGIPLPEYTLLYSTGPEHDKKFTVSVGVAGVGSSTGIGVSKKDAEKDAAGKLWKLLPGA